MPKKSKEVVVLSKEQQLIQSARTVGVECRHAFTNAIQMLCGYIDPQGCKSKSGKQAYPHFTNKLYRCLGLSKSEADDICEGKAVRDRLNAHMLNVLALAEMEASALIVQGIKNNLPRRHIKDEIEKLFNSYGALTVRCNRHIEEAYSE